MAVVPNRVVQLGQLTANSLGQTFFQTNPVLSLDEGTALDLSAFDQINMHIRVAPGSTNLVTGLTGYADGTIEHNLQAANFAPANRTGSYPAVIIGRNLATDPFVLLAQGTISYTDFTNG